VLPLVVQKGRKDFLKSHAERLQKESEAPKHLVHNLREMLKSQVQKKLEGLPNTLKDLEPKERLSIICKMLPFVLPTVESVHFEKGEPG
jgi:hypothetical protein